MNTRSRAAKKGEQVVNDSPFDPSKKYVIEYFAGIITSVPSPLCDVTKPSILCRYVDCYKYTSSRVILSLRYKGYGQEYDRWQSIQSLRSSGMEEAVEFFLRFYRPLFGKDFEISRCQLLILPALDILLCPLSSFPVRPYFWERTANHATHAKVHHKGSIPTFPLIL